MIAGVAALSFYWAPATVASTTQMEPEFAVGNLAVEIIRSTGNQDFPLKLHPRDRDL